MAQDSRLSTADLVNAARSPVQASTPPEDRLPAPDGDAGLQRPAGQPEALVELFNPELSSQFRARWDAVQIGFVDDPKSAVQQADELVAQVMTSLAESFAKERSGLEKVIGDDDGSASTENLRMALRRYRSFFQRLLSL
jgi:hypothetical protein